MMRKRIRILPGGKKIRAYDILIGENILSALPKYILQKHGARRILVITDTNVKRYHGKKMLESLEKEGIKADMIAFKAGERQKTRKTKEAIEDEMLKKGFGRDSLIIAFGGGVTGDIAGFVSATFNRGIPYIQVSTSFLAMVDSSIGGKTGVDTEFGKNLIGAFHQPSFVIEDFSFLETLPDVEFKNGLAEAVKYSIIFDQELFYFIEKYQKELLEKDAEVLKYVIGKCCYLKGAVIEKDEKETGLRQALNFGHTIGHAIEKTSQYSVLHGFAVAFGMVAEARIAVKTNVLDEQEFHRIFELIKGLDIFDSTNTNFDIDAMIGAMTLDKKSIVGKNRIVIVEKVGKVKKKNRQYSFHVDEKIVREAVLECKKLR
ncbi:MAG: 3-dehydroquinate synthase [Nanoarchaeota archaeon]|nr:3-dehydroquinate synthase [Nanoarchaeota archaeon]